MLTWEIWSRVVRFEGEHGASGTAFVMDVDGADYLVTARHLTSSVSCENVTLHHAYSDSLGPDKKIVCPLNRMGQFTSSKHDVAVFELPDGLLNVDSTASVEPSSDGQVFSQECFILGFPYLRGFGIGDGYKLPLARRGTISGQWTSPAGPEMTVVDAISNPGMSGGPVVFRHQRDQTWHISAVVAQSLDAPLHAGSAGPDNPHVPSGFSLATDISRAVDLARQGPSQ